MSHPFWNYEDQVKELGHKLSTPLARKHIEFARAHVNQAIRAELYEEADTPADTHNEITKAAGVFAILAAEAEQPKRMVKLKKSSPHHYQGLNSKGREAAFFVSPRNDGDRQEYVWSGKPPGMQTEHHYRTEDLEFLDGLEGGEG